MTRTIALKLQSHSALAAMVYSSGNSLVVEGVVSVPLAEGADAKSRGQAIRAGLAAMHPGRAPAVVIIPRSELSWQNYDLPPSPIDDLPDLVHLQAQRDLPLADDGLGFDYLPLTGDEEHPHRVLGVGILPAQLERLRETCEAAELKLERILPEPLGWPELGRRVQVPADAGLIVFAAMADRQAVVWATEGSAVRMIRTIWLSEERDVAADVSTLGGDLRRTLMALSNSPPAGGSPPHCVYLGQNAPAVAAQLSKILSRTVEPAELADVVSLADADPSTAPLVELAPLAGLAVAAGDRRAHVDLLHPRRRPAPPSQKRTYVLAAVAAACAAAALAWTAYRNLQEPLEVAASAAAERTALESRLETLAEVERKAAAIGSWVDDSVNLLDELDRVSMQLRPEALDSEQFKAEQDAVLTKLGLAKREITLDAAVKSSDALPTVEGRLRQGDYRVDRGATDANSKAVPEYGVGVSETVERNSDDASRPEAPK